MAIYIPKKINVGYQERKDTYTGKLAYVIYYDEKGRLRKESSWNSWRNQGIPNSEYDNEPIDGFVLNKKVGDYSNGWDHRKSYCRVYDPRGFEFEISIENLLFILENVTSTVGKGLDGKFVYAWDGTELLLLPVASPDYQEIMKYSEIVNNNNYIKAKDLKIGATYLGKNQTKYVYMGRYDKYEHRYLSSIHGYIGENVGKHYAFCYMRKDYHNKDVIEFDWVKSLGQKLISCINENCCENYADLFDELESCCTYSPIDPSKEKHIYYTFDEFKKYVDKSFSWADVFVGDNNKPVNIYKRNGKYALDPDSAKKYGFKLNRDDYTWAMTYVSLKDIYEKIKPYYKEKYLANGRLYEKEGI